MGLCLFGLCQKGKNKDQIFRILRLDKNCYRIELKTATVYKLTACMYKFITFQINCWEVLHPRIRRMRVFLKLYKVWKSSGITSRGWRWKDLGNPLIYLFSPRRLFFIMIKLLTFYLSVIIEFYTKVNYRERWTARAAILNSLLCKLSLVIYINPIGKAEKIVWGWMIRI